MVVVSFLGHPEPELAMQKHLNKMLQQLFRMIFFMTFSFMLINYFFINLSGYKEYHAKSWKSRKCSVPSIETQ
jgi:hypothetical protein